MLLCKIRYKIDKDIWNLSKTLRTFSPLPCCHLQKSLLSLADGEAAKISITEKMTKMMRCIGNFTALRRELSCTTLTQMWGWHGYARFSLGEGEVEGRITILQTEIKQKPNHSFPRCDLNFIRERTLTDRFWFRNNCLL